MTSGISKLYENRRANQQLLRQLTVGDLCFVVLFNLLLFESVLEKNIWEPFSYLDEGITVLLVAIALVKAPKCSHRLLNKNDRICIGLLFLLLAIGLISSISSELNIPTYMLAVDAFTCCKFLFMYLSCLILMGDTSRILKILVVEAKILVVVMAVFGLGSIVYDFGMSGAESRFGIHVFNFIFYHSSVLVWVGVALTAVLVADKRTNSFFIVAALIAVCLTLRFKGICWAALVVIFLMNRSNKKLGLPYILAGLLAAGALGYEQMSYYYGSDAGDTSRGAMMLGSIQIMLDYFPLGSGFASFGSAMASDLYSPLYYEYGLSTVYGLMPAYHPFASDTFWPIVIGQFGFIGTVLVILLFLFLVKSVLLHAGGSWVAPTVVLSYLLLSSLGETSIFNPFAVLLAFSLAVIIKNDSLADLKVEVGDSIKRTER